MIYQLESEAEAVLNYFIEYASSRWLDCHGLKLVSLLFGNHFVVELLWPRREGDVDRVPNQKLDLRFKLLVQACAFNKTTAELRHMHFLNKAKDCSKL